MRSLATLACVASLAPTLFAQGSDLERGAAEPSSDRRAAARSEGAVLDLPAPFTAALQSVRIPVHTQAADPQGGGYGVWAAGTDYKVSFHDHFTFIPMLGGGYPHNQPLSWETTAVTSGGHSIVDVSVAPERRADGYRYEYRFDRDFVEAYDVLPEGAEQSFILATRPAHAGDVVVEGRITTAMEARAFTDRAQRITFFDEQGNALVHYGQAVAIDALGRRRDVLTSWDGDRVRLTVPGGWLTDAAFPLTIDPLLTRECVAYWGSPPISPDGAVRTTDIGRDDLANQPAITYTRQASAADADLWCWLFDDDTCSFAGRNQIFVDITTSWSTIQSNIGFVGGNADSWVLAFTRVFAPTSSAVRMHCHASNDKTLGTAVNGLPVPLGFRDRGVDVGGTMGFSTGDDAMLVFERDDTLSFDNTQVFGVLVDAVNCTFGSAFPLRVDPSRDQQCPAINQVSRAGADGWFAVWQEFWNNRPGGDDWDVLGQRYDGAGVANSGTYVVVNAIPDTIHQQAPKVEGTHDRYMVTFTTQEPGGTLIKEPKGGETITAERVDWPLANSSPTPRGWCEVIRNTGSTRWQNTGLAYDSNSTTYWYSVFHSTVSGASYAALLGFDAGTVELNTTFAMSGFNGFASAATFNDDENFPDGQTLISFATDESGATCGGVTPATHPVYSVRMDPIPQTTSPNPYGLGCGGSIGWAGSNRAGWEFFDITLSAATPGFPAALFIGSAATGTSLAPIQMPGCFLNTNPIVQRPIPIDAFGNASFRFPLVACSFNLRGVTFYWQWAFIAPGLNPLGVATTRGLRTPIN